MTRSAVGALLRDIRSGIRALRWDPGVSLIAVLSLTLAIAANTAVFSAAHAYLLRDWQVRSPEHLVFVRARAATGERIGTFLRPTTEQLRTSPSFDALSAVDESTVTVIVAGQPEVVYGDFVTGDYFPMLGVRPSLGRLLLPSDDRPGQPAVAVLSHGYWTTRFASDPAVIGTTIVMKDLVCTIVGVTAPDYFGRRTAGQAPAVTVPMSLQPRLALKDHLEFELIGRLKEAVSPDAARAQLDAVYQHALREGTGSTRESSHIELQEARRGDSPNEQFARQVWILQIVAGIVLLIAAINVASLQLARGIARQHELAVRLALGASRAQLIRQLLVESALLSCAGGLFGLYLAQYCARVLLLLTRGGGDPSIPASVVLFDTALILIVTIICGIVPAVRLTRLDAASGIHGASLRTRGPRTASRVGWSLVVIQVALSIVLLIPAGLLARSVHALSRVNLGFNPDRLVTMWIFPTLAGFDGPRELDVYAQLLDRLNAMPGVEAASFSRYSILRRGRERGLTIHGDRDIVDSGASYVLDAAAPRFFEAMGLRVVAGRDFSRFDTATSIPVAVINEELARRYFAAGRAVGRSVEIQGAKREVIGLVSDMRFGLRDRQPVPAVYIAYTQAPEDMRGQMLLKIRTTGEPGQIVPLVRRELQAIASTLAPVSIELASASIANSARTESSLAALVSASSAMAMFLAMIGLYATMTQAVRRRTMEIGVRLAVGARPSDILLMILRQVSLLVAAGLLVGIPCALGVVRTVSSFLFGVGETDPMTAVTSTLLIAGVTAIAGYLPARRAARIDPLIALRRE